MYYKRISITSYSTVSDRMKIGTHNLYIYNNSCGQLLGDNHTWIELHNY